MTEQIVARIEAERVDLAKKPADLDTQAMWEMWNIALDRCIQIVRETTA